MKKILVLFFICFVITHSSFSQENFNNSKRAEYIFSIVEKITWPKSEKTNDPVFTITYLGSDTSLYYALEMFAEQKKTIHNKKIEIRHINELDIALKSQVLFVNKKEFDDIGNIYNQVKERGILLIGEGYNFNESMVNFIVVDGKRRFEVNEKRMLEDGFSVSPLFLALAVKTKQDWETLYKQTEQLLGIEREVVRDQKKIIQEQNSTIITQDSLIFEKAKQLNLQKLKLKTLFDEIEKREEILQEKNSFIEARKNQIIQQKKDLLFQGNDIKLQQDILRKQQNKIENQESVLIGQLEKIRTQNILISLLGVLFFMVLVTIYVLIRAFLIKKRTNKALHLKNIEIERQRDKIIIQNKEITDSIIYARRIQTAILPPEDILANNVCDHFLYYKPRDIVSGDYYWMTEQRGKFIIAAADCTGHGVPGAFMSMLGIAFLNEIVKEKQYAGSGEILNKLRLMILEALNQTEDREETKDGMDMALCIIDRAEMICQYSGAYNPLYLIRDNELIEYKADKMPVGLSEKKNIEFSENRIILRVGDIIYMFSDGYPDQFGGPHNKKFMTKRFKNLLLSIQHENMDIQRKILNDRITEWMRNSEQIDDILVVGMKI